MAACLDPPALWGPKKEGTFMTNPTINWAHITDTSIEQGIKAFFNAIVLSLPDASTLVSEETTTRERMGKALERAKGNRRNPGPDVQSAVANWAKAQALSLISKKHAGEPLPADYHTAFQEDLRHQVEAFLTSIQTQWSEEDAKVASSKQAGDVADFVDAAPIISNLAKLVLDGERQRQTIFIDGQNQAQKWAGSYETSLQQREKALEQQGTQLQAQAQELSQYQQSLRSGAVWDTRTSHANSVMSTGRNAFGCVVLWVGLALIVWGAIYFSFPH